MTGRKEKGEKGKEKKQKEKIRNKKTAIVIKLNLLQTSLHVCLDFAIHS